MARMRIIFDGFSELARKFDDDTKLKKAVNASLTKTVEVVNKRLAPAVNKYIKGNPEHKYATGKMKSSMIKNANVMWDGDVAEVRVGFDLNIDTELHSIYVMYGTEKMNKDIDIYNAIRGQKTRKEIARVQKETMEKYLE